MKNPIIFLAFCMAALLSCKVHKEKTIKVRQQPQRQKPKTVSYQVANAKQWLLINTDSTNL